MIFAAPLAGMALLLASTVAAAQSPARAENTAVEYPSKPVRWVVPYPAGASNDVVARTVAQKLSATWRHQVIIDNRAGAGGTIAATLVAKATSDGYTLLLANPGPSVNNPLLQQDAQYRVEDFFPVVFIGYTPLIVVANPSFAPNNARELVQYCFANPGKVSWGSVGYGSSVHIGLALFQSVTGVNVLHVPYKGAAQSITELIGGQIQVMHSTMPSSAAQIKARKMKVLAVAGKDRLSAIPEVPTLSEQGITGADSSNWFGVVVPAATPRTIVSAINSAVNAALQTAEVRQRLESLDLTIAGGSPAEFETFMRNETQRVRALIKTGALTLQ